MQEKDHSATLDDVATPANTQALQRLREAIKAEKDIDKRIALMEAIMAAREAVQSGTDGQVLGASRERMARLYEFDGSRTQTQRKKQNQAAIDLLEQIRAGQVDRNTLTLEQKQVLANYSGTGGGLTGENGKRGSQHEYYTPAPIAQGMWDALADMGFTGGKVLDPCAGTGIFGATAPQNAVMEAIELSRTSGEINEIVNGGPGYKVTISPFEAVVQDYEDDSFDAVVTNVPFGGLAARGENAALDKTPEYRKETLENYFILRSLRKLRPGGLAAFICPTACVSGKQGANKRLREKASYMAEFLGAYRLPNAVFGSAAADVMTDVVFFRKHSRELKVKIDQLRIDSPEVLEQSNILYKPFLDGKYFIGEGKRFVLGTMKKRINRFGKESEFLNADVKVGDLGKMLRRFGDSRIDWDLLDVTETQAITYNEGDTIIQDGETLRLEAGLWVPVSNAAMDATSAIAGALLGKFETPMSAFEAKAQYGELQQLQRDLAAQAKLREMPAWAGQVLNENARTPVDRVNKHWLGGIVGLAVEQVLDENRLNAGFNYLDGYPALSEAMQTQWGTANSAGGAIAGSLKRGLNAILAQYNKKEGFKPFWRGDIQEQVEQKYTTADRSIDGLRYLAKSKWIGVEAVKEVLGPDFDPMQSDDWCISADGKTITRASDYYVGNYADFLRDLDKQIAAASDPAIRDKLLRQKTQAFNKVERINVDHLEFNLFSPHVTAQEKANFLRLFVDSRADVVQEDGQAYPAFVIPNAKTDREKLLNRLNHYLMHASLKLGNAKLSMPDEQGLAELKRMAITANEQFNQWVRSNTVIMGRLKAVADDPENLRFSRIEDGEPIEIPGMNPDLKLRFYQSAFVRQQAREFGGGNGFDVGLGKTFASLAAVQYVQSIGVKKKTLFVVPGAVLSNWRKESKHAFQDSSDCLYVGMRESSDGSYKFSPANYDADLHAIKENRHSKIFLTYQAFEKLRMRTETIEGYVSYMRSVDKSFAEVEKQKEDDKNKSKTLTFKEILTKENNAPFIEDLGIDSIVVDEAHSFKNNAVLSGFKGGKFLSIAAPAKRGLDMQAKAWYIRGQSPIKDGVMLLTASPITNSPLEIYSMMSLAVGHERINERCLGIKGADDFMNMMCNIESESDLSIDGITREINVFKGLNNVDVLRKVVNDSFNIKDQTQVGHAIVMPNSTEQDNPIELPDEIKDKLFLYQSAYRFAIDTLNKAPEIRGDPADFAKVSEYFGEPMELIGHPFNLINKMTLLIADPELDQRATFYSFDESQTQIAQAVIDKFNAKKITETRDRLSPFSEPDAYKTIVTMTEEGKEKFTYKVQSRAYIQSKGRILIDTMDMKTQLEFEKFADSLGLGLDVTIPPKIAALIENVKKERANPRGIVGDEVSPIVKQIVFCDTLPLINKIKRALSKYAGIPSGAIAVVTGQVNNSPDEIMEVQEGFNADGEENRYQLVLANEKAEVGINLQKGTQAIHHLTIGWTPDSLQQRNGRGVRQGNKTQSVTIYQYDAEGTFDSHKRTMVGHKANWIEQVMAPDGANSLSIEGGLNDEQYDMLIETMGDAQAMQSRQAQIERDNAIKRASSNRERQKINLETIVAQRDFLDENAKPDNLVIRKLQALQLMRISRANLERTIANPKASATAIAKAETSLAILNARFSGFAAELDEACKITYTRGSGQPVPAEQLLNLIGEGSGNSKWATDAEIRKKFKGSYPSYAIEVMQESALYNDWKTEVEQAQGMLTEAIRSFEQQAQKDGAFNATIASKFAQNKGRYFDGVPLVTGSILRIENELGVYDHDGQRFLYIHSGNLRTMQMQYLDRSEMKVYNEGDSGWQECVQELAKAEDDAAQSGNAINDFSELVPAVASARKTVMLRTYERKKYYLPAPYFPIVVAGQEAANGAVMKALHESQKPVVKSIDWNSFVVETTLAVTPSTGQSFDNLVLEYAKANSMQVTRAEIYSPFFEPVVTMALSAAQGVAGGLGAAMGEASTELQAAKKAFDWLQDALPFLDMKSYLRGDLTEDAVRSLFAKMQSDFFSIYHEKISQARALEHGNAGSTTAASSTTAATGSNPKDYTDLVAIAGDYEHTSKWKDSLKEVGGDVVKTLDGYVQGDAGYKWDAENKKWNVHRKTWEAFITKYPDAAKVLQLVPATVTTLGKGYTGGGGYRRGGRYRR